MAQSITCVDDRVLKTWDLKNRVRIMEFSCVSAADKSFSMTVNEDVTGVKEGNLTSWDLFYMESKPGGTAVTDGTDLTLKNAFGADLLGGSGTNLLDATTVEEAHAMVHGVDTTRPIDGDLTMATANNDVANATFTVRLILKLGV